jgi:hypothetical protein
VSVLIDQREAEQARVGGGRLAWAVYLACSWTWCIGMFLPALLVRDLGVWAFVVFAVPNIVGAAALAWVMSTPGSSQRLLEEHRWAVWAFSSLTIAFQVYFAAWVASLTGHRAAFGVAIAGVVLAALPGVLRAWWHGVGVVVWLIAAGAVGWMLVQTSQGAGGGWGVIGVRGDRPMAELVPMAAVCVLGFLLCPYLDATFHRARIEAERGGAGGGAAARGAFAMGFGWFFAAMIVGTLIAAPSLLAIARGEPVAWGSSLAWFLLGCTSIQLLYTVRVHAMECRKRAWLALPGALVVAVVMVWGEAWLGRVHSDLRIGEIVYRSFMGLYGLVFPAYVLCCMVPVHARGRRVTGPTSGRVAFFIAGVLCAMPFYWLGFMERQTWWVLAGIGVVLAAGIGAWASVRRAAR